MEDVPILKIKHIIIYPHQHVKVAWWEHPVNKRYSVLVLKMLCVINNLLMFFITKTTFATEGI